MATSPSWRWLTPRANFSKLAPSVPVRELACALGVRPSLRLRGCEFNTMTEKEKEGDRGVVRMCPVTAELCLEQ
jgi:hypothetical protein